jgi:hypothetical protein
METMYSCYTFLTSSLDGDEWLASSPGRALPPGESTTCTHWTGGWVGLKAGLDTEARGEILLPLPGFEPRSPSRPVLSQKLYWLSCPGSSKYIFYILYLCAVDKNPKEQASTSSSFNVTKVCFSTTLMNNEQEGMCNYEVWAYFSVLLRHWTGNECFAKPCDNQCNIRGSNWIPTEDKSLNNTADKRHSRYMSLESGTNLFMSFMSMGWDDVSELQPTTGLFFNLLMIYEYDEPWWNDTDREKSKNSEKNLSNDTLCTKPTWTDPGGGGKICLRSERLETNRLILCLQYGRSSVRNYRLSWREWNSSVLQRKETDGWLPCDVRASTRKRVTEMRQTSLSIKH